MIDHMEQFDVPIQRELSSFNSDKCDRIMLVTVICLILLGILMVYSSTSVVMPGSREAKDGAGLLARFQYLKKHLFSLTAGGIFMFFAYRYNLKKLYTYSFVLIALALVLVSLVFVPGIGMRINGASRWIRFWPSTFQPSEFVKFAMIVFLARYVSSPRFDPHSIACFIKPILVMALFQTLFLLQPDFGSAITLALITFTMLFLSGFRLRYLLGTAALLTPAVVVLLKTPYRLKRIIAFLDPWSDPQGAGYQLVQSYIALGSGGLAGIGLGESKQKLSFLPYANTDFIFSLMGEELGFIGTSLLLSLFALLFYRGIRIANEKRNPFHYYLAQGLTCLIIYQVLINVAVVTGLAPTKGLPLPFISYGGSAVFINMLAVGFLLNLSKRYKPAIETGHASDDVIKRKKAKIMIYGRIGKRDGRYGHGF
ncbi:MAG: putative lipid II flippase FtsW [Nitrospirota bacterium]|nr:MAG: putative lipid II flippase FtsW [Nitrospirota bacterium]